MIENISPAGLVVGGSAGDRRGWNEGHVCVCRRGWTFVRSVFYHRGRRNVGLVFWASLLGYLVIF